jgi:putative transcriptional regulator
LQNTLNHSLSRGQCLIAPPHIQDPRFARTVILLVQHDTQGSLGFVINRPTDYTLGQITDTDRFQNISNRTAHWGGPVNGNVVHVLHTRDWRTSRSLPINPEISFTSDAMMFDYIDNGQQPNQWRTVMGVASWGPGQLEGELKGEEPWYRCNSWLVLPHPHTEMLFGLDGEEMWNEAITFCSYQAFDNWF